MSDRLEAVELVAKVGRQLYGNDWAPQLAADLKMNKRTLQRIKAAAEAGDGYPVSPGVLEELQTLARSRAKGLEGVAAQVEAFRRRAPPQPG